MRYVDGVPVAAAVCRMDRKRAGSQRASDFRLYVSKNVVRRRAVVAKKRFAERNSFSAVRRVSKKSRPKFECV